MKNKKDGLYWLIPDKFFDENSDTPDHINRIYRSALGQVWMKKYNKSYDDLYSWYWYDDINYRPKCPYCNKNTLDKNELHDGIHGSFNIYRYYKSTCNSIDCINKFTDDLHESLAIVGSNSLKLINESINKPDYIARSNRSRLINNHEYGYFYVAYTESNQYKFGVSSYGIANRNAKFFGETYKFGYELMYDLMTKIANFEYNLKSINNWKETYSNFKDLKSDFKKVISNEKCFEYVPGGLKELCQVK